MKYRHQRMVRAREQRRRERAARQLEVEAVLRDGLTSEELRVWRAYSDAIGRRRVEGRTG